MRALARLIGALIIGALPAACTAERSGARTWGAPVVGSDGADRADGIDEWGTFVGDGALGIEARHDGRAVATLEIRAASHGRVELTIERDGEVDVVSLDDDESAEAFEEAVPLATALALGERFLGDAEAATREATDARSDSDAERAAEALALRPPPLGSSEARPIICEIRALGDDAIKAAVVTSIGLVVGLIARRNINRPGPGSTAILTAATYAGLGGFTYTVFGLPPTFDPHVADGTAQRRKTSVTTLLGLIHAYPRYARAAFSDFAETYCTQSPVSFQVRKIGDELEIALSRPVPPEFFDSFPGILVASGSYSGYCWSTAFGGGCIDGALAIHEAVFVPRESLGDNFLRGERVRVRAPRHPAGASTVRVSGGLGAQGEMLSRDARDHERPAYSVVHPLARSFHERFND